MPESRWIDPGRSPERPVTLAELSRRIKVLENIHKDEITLYTLDSTGTSRAGGVYYYKTIAEAAKHILQHPTQNFEMKVGDLCEDPDAIDIPNYAFSRFSHPSYGPSGYFENLCKVYLGPTETIGNYAFEANKYLTVVEFPKVKTIGQYAFHWCPIKKLFFPKTLTLINQSAFYALNYNGSSPYTLEEVIFEEGGTEPLTLAPDCLGYNGPDYNWHSVVLPERIDVLLRNSISNCEGLYCVKTNKKYSDRTASMGWVDDYSVGWSGRLLFVWDTVNVMLDQCDANGVLLVDDGNHPEYHMDFDTKERWTEWTEQIALSSVKIYAQLTFQNPNDPDLYWGANEYSGCQTVRVIVKGSYGEIDGNILGVRNTNSNSYKLKYVDIEEGVTKIQKDAFRMHQGLVEVNIPSSMVTMEDGVFYGCEGAFTININKPEGSIAGAPWGATNATVNWLG